MNSIKATIVADSVNQQGNRITSFILTYPRFIHAELMTHRMFSRGSASSRAIPFKKMLKMVEEDPFYPIAWQKDHSGMQGVEYITDENQLEYLKDTWKMSRECMTSMALSLNKMGQLTKQLCNRLLEPFMWHTVLVTATEFSNFFELRCPKYQLSEDAPTFKSWKDLWEYYNLLSKDNWLWINGYSQIDKLKKSQLGAEIHMQTLAEAMWDARNESTPVKLRPGEWHIPFGDQIDRNQLHDYGIVELDNCYDVDDLKLSVAIARCARLSYMTFENEIDYKKDIELTQMLFKNKHMSPFEHVARCMTNEEYHEFLKGRNSIGSYDDEDMIGWCNNFKGFIPYRYLIENNIKN